MSKQFYNYLAKKVIEYFKLVNVKNGDKFDIQFEKEDEVRSLYTEIKAVIGVNKFVYKAKEGSEEYETYSFNIGEIDVIVSATIDGIQPDYLTRLRNEVGGNQNAKFNNTAIIFIHNTTLDSIVAGATSFKKEGMPFHISSIINDIRKDVIRSPLNIGQKNVIEFELNKNSSLDEDSISLMQFDELLKVINKGIIEKEDYKNFGLFYDNHLENFSGEEAQKRIKENAENFARVDSIHKFHGDIQGALEKFLDEKGAEALGKPECWDEVEFSLVMTSIEDKKKTKKVQYVGYELFNIEEENFWDKPDKETEAGKRKRRIIIFNPDREAKLQLSFKFDEKIFQKKIAVEKGQEADAKASGKKILVEIDHEIGKASFNTIKLRASENYEFKIVVLDIDNKLFKDTELQTDFNLAIDKISKENVITLNTEQSELVLNKSESYIENIVIKEQNESIIIDSLDAKIIIKNSVEIGENTNSVRLNLCFKGFNIPLAIKDEENSPVRISGYNVWVQKREEKKDFKYKEDRLIQGSRTYFATDDFRVNLKKEEQLIADGSMFFIEKHDELSGEGLDVPQELKDSYALLLNYFRVNNILPSLAYYSQELIEISLAYVQEFINSLDSLEEGGYVKNIHRNLARIGVIKVDDNEEQVLLTPLHPINIMYQIVIQKEVGSERLHETLLKKLESIYLLPYITYNKDLYKPLEQNHSKEWKYYVKNNTLKYKSSRKFVSKLVKEKIDEFSQHFSYLFKLSSKAPIKINLINTGDSKEVLQGIINFYVSELKNKKIKELRDICINIYSMDDSSIFEELSYYETVKEVEENLYLDIELIGLDKDYNKEDILAICREKIKFYRKDIYDEIYEYCHITFYEMDPNIDEKDSKQNDMVTGISLNGIISGVPSRFINNSYRTGFGSKYMDSAKDILLLNITSKLNALYRSVQFETSFTNTECRTTVISKQDKEKLDKIYNSSNWVTFIEPKVDLKFFKNDSKNKDLLIIHYSDQYTSSSGYDAITVTRKSEQYELIIKEYLKDKNIEVTDESITNVINCFNAINGDWLLRLISDKSQFPREKISLISAIKLSMAYFYHKDIIWIPISLEEVLRVSRGAGLSGTDGLFSIKNLKGDGQYSDDLLLVGIEVLDEDIKVYYYPIEVKIGDNPSTVLNKAKKQAYKTRNYLERHLIEFNAEDETRRFTKKMYRNFMMQLAIVSAEKMKLYEIWKEQNWDQIIDSEVRKKLLNDEYTISNELDEIIGRGAIISFKKGIIFNDESNFVEITKPELDFDYVEKEFNRGNKFMQITFAESQGYNNVIRDTETIKNSFINGQSDFNESDLFANIHKSFKKIKDEISLKSIDETDDKNSNCKVEVDSNKDENKLDDEETVFDEPLTILFGTNNKTTEEIKWYPTDTSKILHTNTGIIGTMGTGKTQFTKSLIYQLNENSNKNVDRKKIGLLIFDYKGDYIDSDFVNATNAKIFDIYKLPYNPLALVKGSNPKPLLPLHTANAVKETISKAFNLGIKQETLLRDIIMKAYEKKGINKANASTWESLPPTLNEVCRIYLNSEDSAQDSLYAALKNLYEFEIFESDPVKTKPLLDIIDGVTVIKLSGYDQGIQNLVVAITLDVFYTQMLTLGESKMHDKYRQLTNLILVDEADNFLSKNFGSLRKILKEGRMFGVGTILSTQLLSHFSTGDNEYANYILTWIVHNVSDLSNKDVKFIFNTKGKDEEEAIYNKIKTLVKHQSLIKLGGESGPIYMRDKAFWEFLK
jgi:DNA phosphorothioation-dependent restriction protein DptH